MKFIKDYWHKIVLFSYFFIVPIISFAADNTTPSDPSQSKIIDPLGGRFTIPELVQTLLKGVLKIGMPIIALAIIYCGFLFVKAQGNSEELTKAKDALIWTLVGAAILLGAWAIAEMISATVTAL